MDEKHLRLIPGIGAEDWVRPTDRQRQTASSGVRFEDRTARAASQRITGNGVYTDSFFSKIVLKVFPSKHFTIL